MLQPWTIGEEGIRQQHTSISIRVFVPASREQRDQERKRAIETYQCCIHTYIFLCNIRGRIGAANVPVQLRTRIVGLIAIQIGGR
jgi:hypothetical protein